jgi:predicted DNA-binding WGR domain protein
MQIKPPASVALRIIMNYRWEKNHRYYEAQLTQDLFGWVILRSWGRKGTRNGRSMTVRPESYDKGMEMLEAVKKRRRSRGYEMVTQ